MTRSILIILLFFQRGSILNVSAVTTVPYSQRMADSQMVRSGTSTLWDYPNGLFAESVLKVYNKYGGAKYYT